MKYIYQHVLHLDVEFGILLMFKTSDIVGDEYIWIFCSDKVVGQKLAYFWLKYKNVSLGNDQCKAD